MMSQDAHLVLQLALAFGLWWLFAFAYCRYRLESLRQTLFAIRDALFLEACKRELLDLSAYLITRTTLNGMIRFAHEISFSHFLILYFGRKHVDPNRSGEAYLRRLMESVNSLKLEDSKLIVSAHAQAHLAILDHVVHTSILLAPPAFLAIAILHVIQQATRVAKIFTTTKASRNKWAILDAEANELGEDLQVA